MSQPLRMDEMGPGVSSWDLEACRMSNEAPADDEVADGINRYGKFFSCIWLRSWVSFDPSLS